MSDEGLLWDFLPPVNTQAAWYSIWHHHRQSWEYCPRIAYPDIPVPAECSFPFVLIRAKRFISGSAGPKKGETFARTFQKMRDQ